MMTNKKIVTIVDVKNSQAYVGYEDGSYGFCLLQFVPVEVREAYFKGK